jgi:pimeloyl-ACP methyl ester carboxylesterase
MKKKKIVVWTAVGIPLFLVAGLIFIVASSYLDHRQLVDQEKEQYPAPGVLVEIPEHPGAFHVYAEGRGEHTLVFLSGLGTSSPLYDFKVLYERLSDEFRVAVVERAGYGWSEITCSSRDLDTVLHETRTALRLAGERPPYVLFPHSLAGLEALYWASLYPEEISAIIGLDPLVPEYHEQSGVGNPLSHVITVLARTGLMRSGPEVFSRNFPAMVKGHLDEEDAEVAETLFFRRVHTQNMWDEVRALPENSQLVIEQGKPDVPFHVFVSDQAEESWKESLVQYAHETGGEYFFLDADHYIHLDKPERIAEIGRELIRNVSEN